MAFSIIIPTWNNLPYLQLCLSSIAKNSHFKNQVIVYVNEGSDGTVEWLEKQEGIDFLHSDKNVGVCVAVNSCRKLVRCPYIIYLNDDMYVCPDWDLELYKEIEKIGHDQFLLSATAIEPYPVKNPNLVSVIHHFGDSVATFRENDLLNAFKKITIEDWSGSSWPPSVMSTRIWDIVGGFSIEFSPGMYSDPDLSMKLWKHGVRIFKGIGASKVYHFQSKSTRRLKKNDGRNMFLMKWGISAKTFYSHYLRMGKPYDAGLLNNPEELSSMSILLYKIKRTCTSFFFKG